MPPAVATAVFAAGVVGLFLLDRNREREVSPALWIPVMWLSISGSRMVSAWLQLAPSAGPESADQYLEGSPFDRMVLTALLAAGVAVLFARWRRSEVFVRANGPILLFFLYCLASVVWSDYPGVAFRRWTKLAGDLVMVMVVLTDPRPTLALKRLMAATAFVLIPASILLIKYYPDLGRGYQPWTWTSFYVGVATGKNGLGYVCLVFGLGSLWRFLGLLRGEEAARVRPLLAHGVVIAMMLWLFWKADSATSLVCFLLGGVLLTVTSLPGLSRTLASAHVVVATVVSLVMSSVLLGTGTGLVEALGRDSTLTGRTELWSQLTDMTVDPLIGTGFESFWLGDRVETIWRMYWWHPTQSHNGYLEVFLNLGVAGVVLLAFVMISSYSRIARGFERDPAAGRFRLAFLAVAAVYNLTEAAFKGFHPVWIAFLLAAATAPDDHEAV